LKLPIEISFWVILSFLRCPFADPWQTLHISSGLRLRTTPEPLFCHSDPERSEGEESTLFFRDSSGYWTRSEWQKGRRPFGFASGWQV